MGGRVRTLNAVQVAGLKRGEFLHEDGAPAESAEIAAMVEVHTFEVALTERGLPTLRGEKKKMHLNAGQCTGDSIDTSGLDSWLLVLDGQLYFFSREIPSGWFL